MVQNFPKLIRDEIYIQQKYSSEVKVNKPFSHKEKMMIHSERERESLCKYSDFKQI